MPIVLDNFVQRLKVSRSLRTASAYQCIAKKFLDFLGERPQSPTRADVESFLVRPLASGQPRAAATYNHELAGMRALAKAMTECGTWQTDPCNGIRSRKESRRDPTFLTHGELCRLFKAAFVESHDIARTRNIAVIALLSQLGLRVHELVALNLEQVDLPSRTLLSVRGKGNTQVDMPMSLEVTSLLLQWLNVRSLWACPEEHGLFVAERTRLRLSTRSVERLVTELWSKCGSPKRVTPHTLRHTAATLLITLDCDISTVGDLLRHESLDTTRRYIGLVGARRRTAVNRLATTIPSDVLPDMQIRSVDPSRNGFSQGRQNVVGRIEKGFDGQEELLDHFNEAA